MIRAAVMPAPGRAMEVRRFAEPELEPGAVLLKTLASEVCGTDVHLWHGRLAGVPYPLIPGHVSVGEVAATGGAVSDSCYGMRLDAFGCVDVRFVARRRFGRRRRRYFVSNTSRALPGILPVKLLPEGTISSPW